MCVGSSLEKRDAGSQKKRENRKPKEEASHEHGWSLSLNKKMGTLLRDGYLSPGFDERLRFCYEPCYCRFVDLFLRIWSQAQVCSRCPLK
jgi:hypothetical protein